MKTFTLLLLFSLLSACSTLPERAKNRLYSDHIPSAWAMEGKLSASVGDKTEIAEFELNRQGEYRQLTLRNSLGFGQMQVQQTQQGLLVDGQLTKLSLQKWMTAEFGWYFPVEKLEQLVFKHDIATTQNWQVKVRKYQTIDGITYPKIVGFKSKVQQIKIKLLLTEVIQLK
jgi:outer membrane biogenesis lipoprotein LolB